MKKKGFTLIELIVVIAIIGVLAAILVPAMLGYIRKSKITSANSAAKSIYTASQSALTDMDAEDRWTLSNLNGATQFVADETFAAPAEDADDDEAAIATYKLKVSTYFSDIIKLADVQVFKHNGNTICVALLDRANYPGSSPVQCTVDVYETYSSADGAVTSDFLAYAAGNNAPAGVDITIGE